MLPPRACRWRSLLDKLLLVPQAICGPGFIHALWPFHLGFLCCTKCCGTCLVPKQENLEVRGVSTLLWFECLSSPTHAALWLSLWCLGAGAGEEVGPSGSYWAWGLCPCGWDLFHYLKTDWSSLCHSAFCHVMTLQEGPCQLPAHQSWTSQPHLIYSMIRRPRHIPWSKWIQ